MVHELIGIQDNKVDLRGLGKLPKDQQVDMHIAFFMSCIVHVIWKANEISLIDFDLQEVVLSSEQDSFFKSNMYENFGDIGMNIKQLVDEFQQVSKSNQNIQTIGLYEEIWIF